MQPPVQELPVRPIVLAFALATSALLSYQAVRIWIADRLVHSTQLGAIARGAALEPGNAAAWDLLGRHRQLDLSNPDSIEALSYYKRAVQDDPLSAAFWMNLAGAYEANGDLTGAQNAFEQARSVYPLSAEVAWNYGNFLLRLGHDSSAYAEIRRAVQSDPRMATLAVSRVWRANHDVSVLLDQALPPEVDPYIQALNFFVSIHQTDAALSVWHRLLLLGKIIPLPQSFLFLDELILADRSVDAKRVWVEALTAAGLAPDEPLNHSLVWNGSFSRDFDNGGLGWRWAPAAGASIDFDSAPASYGVRAVRLDFGGGSNSEITEPMQYVPVEPSRTYRFHAYMRTEQITTESGMRFSIFDPNHNEVNAQTENFTGSRPWSATEMDVTAGPDTHFLLVRLLRSPSRLFENKLSGTVWIADVSLVPTDARGKSSQ